MKNRRLRRIIRRGGAPDCVNGWVCASEGRFGRKNLLTRPPSLEIYRRRACTNKVEVSRAFWRAFDKAVRTKPPAVAADAGLCKFNGGKM
jgi:hypothetical protein